LLNGRVFCSRLEHKTNRGGQTAMPDLLQEMAQKLYKGDKEAVAGMVQQALDQGMSPKEILSGGLVAGMDQVGRDFRADELFIPEVLVAAQAMHAGMNVLRPLLAETGVEMMGKYVIGTVKGDLHDIGKNLVKMMLEGAGFEVTDLGTDVAPETFVDAVREYQPHLVGMSALLTTTMPGMKETIDALEEVGELRSMVKVMVGGAPVTADYAEEIGADAYASDAASAIEVARNLLG
jgi:5-methyltetrahydrofolate--homocysteine methyltransferase